MSQEKHMRPTVEMRRINMKSSNSTRRPQPDDAPVMNGFNSEFQRTEWLDLTSRKWDYVFDFPIRCIEHRWAQIGLSNSGQASWMSTPIDRVRCIQLTSTRSKWNAPAKKSSETEITRPPKATLDNSEDFLVRCV